MSDANVLQIPLPVEPYQAPQAPDTPSFKWCQSLAKALQPLLRFRANDHDVVMIWVRCGPQDAHNVLMAGEDVDTLFSRATDDVMQPDGEKGWWVCTLNLSAQENEDGEWIHFFSADFQNKGEGARIKLGRVIEYLREHAVPQIPPVYVDKAIMALQGM